MERAQGMSTDITLGVDLGGKNIGVAVVERRPRNTVLYSATIELSEDVRKIYKDRRALRRQRRNRLQYRKPDEPVRGGGTKHKATGTKTAEEDKPDEPVKGGGTEAGETGYRRYLHVKGQNKRLRTKCKYVNPETGEVCGKNTPKKSNVAHLLVEDILEHVGGHEEAKKKIRDILSREKGTSSAKRKNALNDALKALPADEHVKKQLRDIVLGDDRTGRTQFCRQHILMHHQQTQVPANVVWLPPYIRTKQDDLFRVLRKISRRFHVSRIVLERANFDLQKIQKGIIDDPEEYQRGHRYGFKNTRQALLHEYANRCCYCGKKGDKAQLTIDHIIPKSKGGGDSWNNLVLACETCNALKSDRTPEEAGMKFYSYHEKWGDRPVTITLKPKEHLSDSRITRYMTQTDQGVNLLKTRLRELFPNAVIEETYGYITQARRLAWMETETTEEDKKKWQKDHPVDAAVVASYFDPADPAASRPVWQCPAVTHKPRPHGRRIFDQNPIAARKPGQFYQRIPIKDKLEGHQIDRVVDKRKLQILRRVAKEFKIYGKKKTFPVEALQRLPFRSAVIKKNDAGSNNTRCFPGGQYFKVAAEVNEAIVVYEDARGKRRYFCIRNRRAFPAASTPPGDLKRELWRFRKGDLVLYDGKQYRVKKLLSNGQLGLTPENQEGKLIHKVATKCRPPSVPRSNGGRTL